MRALSVFVTAAALVAIGTTDAAATTVLQVDVAEMTVASEWVVNTRVVDVAYVDLRSEGEGLYTDITLAIDEVYKGHDVPATYVLRLIGGHGADGLALTVPGMPRFTKGEHAVLFLEPTLGGHVPCGLSQGVWRLSRGRQGQAWVHQSSHDIHMMRWSRGGRLHHIEAPQLTAALTLGQLVAQVYAAQLARMTPGG